MQPRPGCRASRPPARSASGRPRGRSRYRTACLSLPISRTRAPAARGRPLRGRLYAIVAGNVRQSAGNARRFFSSGRQKGLVAGGAGLSVFASVSEAIQGCATLGNGPLPWIASLARTLRGLSRMICPAKALPARSSKCRHDPRREGRASLPTSWPCPPPPEPRGAAGRPSRQLRVVRVVGRRHRRGRFSAVAVGFSRIGQAVLELVVDAGEVVRLGFRSLACCHWNLPSRRRPSRQ